MKLIKQRSKRVLSQYGSSRKSQHPKVNCSLAPEFFPQELILYISHFFDQLSDVVSLGTTCKRFNKILLPPLTRDSTSYQLAYLICQSTKLRIKIRISNPGNSGPATICPGRIEVSHHLANNAEHGTTENWKVEGPVYTELALFPPVAEILAKAKTQSQRRMDYQVFFTNRDQIDAVKTLLLQHGIVMIHSNFWKGKKDGRETRKDAKGKTQSVTEWTEGVRNGAGIWYNNQGNIRTTDYWEKGKRQGSQQQFFDNGRLKENCSWKDGRKHGTYHSFYSTGAKLTTQEWFEDKLNGIEEKWHESQIRQFSVTWIKGQKNGLEQSWNFDGMLCSCTTWQLGKKHGPFTQWFGTGILRTQCNYTNDRLDGEKLEYHSNGIVRMKTTWRRGIRRGVSQTFALNGSTLQSRVIDDRSFFTKVADFFRKGQI